MNTAEKAVLSGIHSLTIEGFKTFGNEQILKIRPLTIISGANSSGKTGCLEALLLLKQTLVETETNVHLKLFGDNVKFSDAWRIFYGCTSSNENPKNIKIGLEFDDNHAATFKFSYSEEYGIRVVRNTYRDGKDINLKVERKRNGSELVCIGCNAVCNGSEACVNGESSIKCTRVPVDVDNEHKYRHHFMLGSWGHIEDDANHVDYLNFLKKCAQHIAGMLHLTGRRSIPCHQMRVVVPKPLRLEFIDLDRVFSGLFCPYVPFLIDEWNDGAPDKLRNLREALIDIRLGRDIIAKRTKYQSQSDDKQDHEIFDVNITNMAGYSSNIFNIGSGVWHAVAILVALEEAESGQILFIEQPEVHLHPNAQVRLAPYIWRASKRGVKVIIETHSSLLLLALQMAIAEDPEKGKFDPSFYTSLNWFRATEVGTEITPGEFCEDGTYGNWPEDFNDVALEIQARYVMTIMGVK